MVFDEFSRPNFIEISAPPSAADYEKHESAEVSLIAMDMVNHFIFDHRLVLTLILCIL